MYNSYRRSYPYYGAGNNNHRQIIEAKSLPNAEYQSIGAASREIGYVDYDGSFLQTHQEEVGHGLVGSSITKLSESRGERAATFYANDFANYYSPNNRSNYQDCYQTQQVSEKENVLPPYYASEEKYSELWVQCPRPAGPDSCEHSDQRIYYFECYDPAKNANENLHYGNQEWTYEDGHEHNQISGHSTNSQIFDTEGNDFHEEQSIVELHENYVKPSTSKTGNGINFKEDEIGTSRNVLCIEESLCHLTSGENFGEAASTVLHSELNGVHDHEQINKHFTKSVSFSSESIQIKVLNQNMAFGNPESSVTEKIHKVRSQRRSRHKRKAKLHDNASVVNTEDCFSVDATAHTAMCEESLGANVLKLSHCDRFQRYLDSEKSKHDFESKYIVVTEQPISCCEKEAVASGSIVNEGHYINSKTRNTSGDTGSSCEIKQNGLTQNKKGALLNTPKLNDGTPPIKQVGLQLNSRIPHTFKVTNKIETLCMAVSSYLPKMCPEQTMLAEQLILDVLGDGLKNSLSESTELVSKVPGSLQVSNITTANKLTNQATQYPECEQTGNQPTPSTLDSTLNGVSIKQSRRKPRWRKKKPTIISQVVHAPRVDNHVSCTS